MRGEKRAINEEIEKKEEKEYERKGRWKERKE